MQLKKYDSEWAYKIVLFGLNMVLINYYKILSDLSNMAADAYVRLLFCIFKKKHQIYISDW